MKQDRRDSTVVMVIALVLGGLLTWWAGTPGVAAIERVYAPYNKMLVEEGFKPLSVIPDALWPHKLERVEKVYPNEPTRDGRFCASNCLARIALDQEILVARASIMRVLLTGSGLLVFSLLLLLFILRANPRRNLVNLERGRVKLKTQGDVLPIIQDGRARWGLMRRWPTGGGRREYGNAIFIGSPGRGKSSLLKWWLLTADRLNFVVIDLKGDLWTTTAGHRAEVGDVIRLDLTSMSGDALDPFDTDDRGSAQSVIEVFLPSNTGDKSDYFNKMASEIALAYWAAARQTNQSAIPVLVKAATSSTKAMLDLARGLVAVAPAQARDGLLQTFEAAFGAIWEDLGTASGGERGSVVQSFKAGFAGLNTPEILSTLCRTTFDPSDLVDKRVTVYVSAPTAESPYKLPLEVLMGAVTQAVIRYVDRERDGKQGEDIVILADEAGTLRVPQFSEVLASGRSRGLTMTAFLQSLGQLDQYHKRGWRGIVDTIHHWTWWNTNDPDAHAFLRGRCGVYDERNPSGDADEVKRRRYIEVHAYDEIVPRWQETEVLSLLDYDRTYPVFGRAVNPYLDRRLKRRMQQPPPRLSLLPYVPQVKVAKTQNVTPSAASQLIKRRAVAPLKPLSNPEKVDDEVF